MNAIPFAILGASLLGSGHCVAMCGGLLLTVARKRRDIFLYHLGRLLGYCALGAAAGFLGETVFKTQTFVIVPWFSTLFLALGFIILGVRLWQNKPLHFFTLPPRFWKMGASYGPASVGLLSAFLPCGWLHTFILGAIATRSSAIGALYLLFFWAGTLPALSAAPLVVRRIFQPLVQKAPRLSAVILISIGVGSLGMKMLPLQSSHKCHDCHHCHHSHTEK